MPLSVRFITNRTDDFTDFDSCNVNELSTLNTDIIVYFRAFGPDGRLEKIPIPNTHRHVSTLYFWGEIMFVFSRAPLGALALSRLVCVDSGTIRKWVQNMHDKGIPKSRSAAIEIPKCIYKFPLGKRMRGVYFCEDRTFAEKDYCYSLRETLAGTVLVPKEYKFVSADCITGSFFLVLLQDNFDYEFIRNAHVYEVLVKYRADVAAIRAMM